MANENCDLELTVLNEVVRSLSHASLDDAQKRRIIQYVTQRCIKSEPRVDASQFSYAQQFGSQYNGIG